MRIEGRLPGCQGDGSRIPIESINTGRGGWQTYEPGQEWFLDQNKARVTSGITMTANHIGTGRDGEDIAAEYLEARGFRVMDRNYRFEHAEVDLVCFEPSETYEHGGELVFVEVKTRRGTGFGSPEEAVSEQKQRHIAHAAEAWLHERRLDGSPCRFDVVAVILGRDDRHQIEQIRDAFWAPGLSGFPIP